MTRDDGDLDCRAMGVVSPLVCPVLVGRDELLDLADRRVEDARRGRGGLLFLAGEAGIGKTRLLAAFETKAAQLRLRRTRGATFPRDIEVAAAPFVDLARSDAGRVVPGLLERLLDGGPDGGPDGGGARAGRGDARAGGGDAHRRRRLLVLDAADLLARAGASGPLLVALEDLHWADDLSLEILATLARRLPETPLLVVATYRSDELYPRVPMRDWRARLLTQRLAEEARLPRLPLEAVATMTTLLLASELPAPHDLVEAVHRRTDGIPLHVEELLGTVIGSVHERGDAILSATVPDTLDDAIRERLGRRTRLARTVARAGAVIGRSFELELLASVVGLPVDPVARAVDELASHFIVLPAIEPGRFDFRHALIRDAIYAAIAQPERRRLHSRVADLTAATADDAFLSVHLEAAGRHEEAFEAALRAGRRAMAISSRHEAYELYRRALRNIPAGITVAEHARLLEEHGAAAAAADDNEGAAESFSHARELYLVAGRQVDAARVLAPYVAARHLLGDGLETRAAVLQGGLAELAGAPGGRPREQEVAHARARLLASLSAAYMLDRRLDESVVYGEQARRLARELGDDRTELDTLATVGSDFVFAGRMDEGWAMLEDAVARARTAQLEAEAARAYRMLGSCASVLVEYERAERSLNEGIEYAERVELWNHRHYMAAHLGHVRWAVGRWDEAERLAAHALADGRGGVTTRITALHVLGYVALGRGDLERARSHLEEARELGEAMRELQRLSPALWGLAETALQAGDSASAIAWCARGREASASVADAAYLFPFLVTGTRAHLAAGDPAAAERWVAEVSPALRHRSIPGTLAAIDHAEGLLALAHGATGQARELLLRAAVAWRERGRVWEGLGAQLDLATASARANRLVEAGTTGAAAAELARAIGSQPLAQRAEELLRHVRARHPVDEPWSPLTVREFEVARLVAAGMTNAQIAGELGVSPRTVGTHVEHILTKLDLRRRAEIAAWATAVRPKVAESA